MWVVRVLRGSAKWEDGLREVAWVVWVEGSRRAARVEGGANGLVEPLVVGWETQKKKMWESLAK